jgi:hypothetical protein
MMLTRARAKFLVTKASSLRPRPPKCLQRFPRRAFVLGLGSSFVAEKALAFGYNSIDAVEQALADMNGELSRDLSQGVQETQDSDEHREGIAEEFGHIEQELSEVMEHAARDPEGETISDESSSIEGIGVELDAVEAAMLP